jgi:hypothetical protein
MNSGNHSTTSYFINSAENRSSSDKVDRIIDTLEEIINTFKTRGCPEGKELLREILQRNHLLGASSPPTANQCGDAHANIHQLPLDRRADKGRSPR